MKSKVSFSTGGQTMRFHFVRNWILMLMMPVCVGQAQNSCVAYRHVNGNLVDPTHSPSCPLGRAAACTDVNASSLNPPNAVCLQPNPAIRPNAPAGASCSAKKIGTDRAEWGQCSITCPAKGWVQKCSDAPAGYVGSENCICQSLKK